MKQQKKLPFNKDSLFIFIINDYFKLKVALRAI